MILFHLFSCLSHQTPTLLHPPLSFTPSPHFSWFPLVFFFKSQYLGSILSDSLSSVRAAFSFALPCHLCYPGRVTTL